MYFKAIFIIYTTNGTNMRFMMKCFIEQASAQARAHNTRDFNGTIESQHISFTIYTHDVKHRSHILNNAQQPTKRPTDCVYCCVVEFECDFCVFFGVENTWFVTNSISSTPSIE